VGGADAFGQRVALPPPGFVFQQGQDEIVRILARGARFLTAGDDRLQHPGQLQLPQSGFDGRKRRHRPTSPT
jgi:hypothetical protein